MSAVHARSAFSSTAPPPPSPDRDFSEIWVKSTGRTEWHLDHPHIVARHCSAIITNLVVRVFVAERLEKGVDDLTVPSSSPLAVSPSSPVDVLFLHATSTNSGGKDLAWGGPPPPIRPQPLRGSQQFCAIPARGGGKRNVFEGTRFNPFTRVFYYLLPSPRV